MQVRREIMQLSLASARAVNKKKNFYEDLVNRLSTMHQSRRQCHSMQMSRPPASQLSLKMLSQARNILNTVNSIPVPIAFRRQCGRHLMNSPFLPSYIKPRPPNTNQHPNKSITCRYANNSSTVSSNSTSNNHTDLHRPSPWKLTQKWK